MKTIIVQNALDFARSLQSKFTLTAKGQLQEVKNLDLWSVSSAVKDMSKTHEEAFQ